MKVFCATTSALALVFAAPAVATPVVIDTGAPAPSVATTITPNFEIGGHFIASFDRVTGVGGYFLNVLPQAQTVTWKRLNTVDEGPGGNIYTDYNYTSGPLGSGTFTLAANANGFAVTGVSGLDIAVTEGVRYSLVFGTTNTIGAVSMRPDVPQPLIQYDLILDQGTGIAPTNQQFGFRIEGEQLNVVPEPATWAMMIVGFGAVGATMRRRQTAKVAFH